MRRRRNDGISDKEHLQQRLSAVTAMVVYRMSARVLSVAVGAESFECTLVMAWRCQMLLLRQHTYKLGYTAWYYIGEHFIAKGAP